jgi:hypothetical protein
VPGFLFPARRGLPGPASATEAQLLVSNGVQPGAWVVNGYGIAPADRTSTPPATESTGKKCWFVLDVQLCDSDPTPPPEDGEDRC